MVVDPGPSASRSIAYIDSTRRALLMSLTQEQVQSKYYGEQILPDKLSYARRQRYHWTAFLAIMGQLGIDPSTDIARFSINTTVAKQYIISRRKSHASYVCFYCSCDFTRKHSLKGKAYCNTIGAKKNLIYIFSEHLQSHFNILAYSCSTCPKSYGSRGALFRHQKRSHKQFPTSETKFSAVDNPGPGASS
jgi:hypothetical protein